MEVEKIVNSCRVCRTGNQDGDFESLYVVQVMEDCGIVESGAWQLTEAGKLYEEMLGLEIDESTMEIYPQYLCNSCDLQMRLFRKLTLKARRNLEALSKIYIQTTAVDSLVDGEEHMEQYLENETSRLKLNERVTLLEINPADINEEFLDQEQEQEQVEKQEPTQERQMKTLEHELDDAASEVFQTLADSDATNSYYITMEDSDDANSIETTTQRIRENRENTDTNMKEINNVSNCKANKLQSELVILSENCEFFDVHYLEEIEENSTGRPESKAEPNTITETERSEKSTVTIVDKRFFQCTACDLEFVKRSDLQKHRKSVHASRYPCPECPKLFNKSDALRVHLQQHRGQPAYKCEVCPRTFNQKVHYKYHMDKHNNVRNFQCTQCHKAFLSKADLSVHTRTHTGERPYECEICGKTYLILQHLKMHRYSHFGRTFECKICEQKFISPSTLRTHSKTIHNSEPRFQCEFCVKRFNRKHHLIAHYKVHQKPVTQIIDRNADIDDPVVDNCELVRNELTENCSSSTGFMEITDVAQIESILVVDDNDIDRGGDAETNTDAHSMYGNENVIVF